MSACLPACLQRTHLLPSLLPLLPARAPEPSDFLWQHTACTGSAALGRRLCSATLTLLIVAAGAGVQYGLAVAGEQERQKRQALVSLLLPAR